MTDSKRAVLAVLALILPGTLACNGYSFELLEIKSCRDDSVMKFIDFNVTLTKDCVAVASGCMEVTEDISESWISYTVKKGLMPFVGKNKNGCKEMDNKSQEVAGILEILGMPQGCPVKKGKYCPKEGEDISNKKRKLLMTPDKYTGRIEIDHGAAGKTCFTFAAVIKNNNRFIGR